MTRYLTDSRSKMYKKIVQVIAGILIVAIIYFGTWFVCIGSLVSAAEVDCLQMVQEVLERR